MCGGPTNPNRPRRNRGSSSSSYRPTESELLKKYKDKAAKLAFFINEHFPDLADPTKDGIDNAIAILGLQQVNNER